MEKERGDGKDGKLARALRARILLKIVFNFNAIFSMFRVAARIFDFHHFPRKSGGGWKGWKIKAPLRPAAPP